MSTDTANNSPAPPPRHRCELPSGANRRWLVLIFLLGLILRVATALALQYQLDQRWQREFLILGDANGYWELGEKLAAGNEYSIYEPPRYALRMPGFPALLAVSINVFGNSKSAARIFMAVLCSLAPVLCYFLGSKLRDERTGLIAALLTAISPVFIAFAPVLLCESVFSVALLGTLLPGCCLMCALPTLSLKRGIVLSLITGVTSAIAIYLKPSWILAVPAFGVLLVVLDWRHRRNSVSRFPRQGLLFAALVVLGMLIPLFPWGLRNARVTGHFKLTTLWMGPSLYDGLNPDATGESDMTFFERDNLPATLSEYEVDQHYKQAAFEFARENPGRVIQLGWEKFKRYWNPWPNASQFDNWLARVVTSIVYVPCLILAAIGLWRERRSLPLLVIGAGPILYFCALHCLFVASLRYRLPGEYPLMIPSAVGLCSLLWPNGKRTEGVVS